MTKTKSKKKPKTKSGNAKPKMVTRKEQRKEKRKEMKKSKLKHYLLKYGKTLEDNVPKNPQKEVKPTKEETRKKNAAQKAEKLKKEQNKQRKKQMVLANKEEDIRIKKLEKQLKLNKRKSKGLPASFKEDGLDYLLEACSAETLQQLGSDDDEDMDILNAGGSTDGSDDDQPASDEDDQPASDEDQPASDEDDEPASNEDHEVSDDDQQMINEDQAESDDDDDEPVSNKDQPSSDEDDEPASDEDQPESEEDESEIDDEDAVGDSDQDFGEEDADENINTGNKKEKGKKGKDGIWEDIYGRTRDAEGNVVTSTTGRYVPPALRAKVETAQGGKSAADAAAMAKLSKQIKGALNRLAESNLHFITRQMEDLYMANSRNLMNECLCQIMTNSLVSPVMTPERLVMEHALLIAVLHANVGNEVGANILQTMVTKYLELYRTTGDNLDNVESKMLDNYLQIVVHMYAFQIVGHDLIFDLLDSLSNSFRAKDVELILLVLKAVGFILRKDDPARLKSLILNVQKKSSEKDRKSETQSLSRVQFMLEVVLAIKNNNVKKIPNYDPTHQAHLQKIAKTFLRPGCSITPLKVCLEDLTSADTRGRWWIVGSAWSGKGANQSSESSGQAASSQEPRFSAKLLNLARKMRMNTDARKNLFCAVMSADDYLDAFERLVKVDKAVAASGTRERDTAFVLLACCLKEPTFNPFYSQLALKLGGFDRKYRMAIQCCIWDRIRDIENLKKHQQNHLAKFTSHLIKDKLLSLTCLKVIEFAELNKVLVKFIKNIILELLSETDPSQMAAPFLVVAGYPKLSTFRDGLRLFLRHFILRSAEKDGQNKVELKSKLLAAEKALMAGEKRLVL